MQIDIAPRAEAETEIGRLTSELSWLRKIKKLENFHIFLWLMKDTSWCNTWVKFGVIVAIPTLILQLYIAWLTRRHKSELIHNIAVCLWLCANITWMSGEFFFNGPDDWFDNHMTWLPSIFFFTGLGLLAVYYAVSFLKAKQRRVNYA